MIKRTWLQMGMPVTVCITDDAAGPADVAAVTAWLDHVDRRYSPYRDTSDVCRLQAGTLDRHDVSEEFAAILRLCDQTRRETAGYFDPIRNGRFDPSGLVKGWAIERAADLLAARGFANYFVDAGGDVRAVGLNGDGQPWRVGIRNPFRRGEVVKVLAISDRGVATSGTAVRGRHIYDPFSAAPLDTDVVSLTVIGPTIFEADRMATAAFAMGRGGLSFIAARPNLEAYAVMLDGTAVHTEGFPDDVR
ncbi:MAG TPA: FAD:protein FMN transferase [Thermomicrobiales bacterium]|jgi:thiamine biosynthesis lipoprotein